jgi:hypothetical protein
MSTNVCNRYYVARGDEIVDVWYIVGRSGGRAKVKTTTQGQCCKAVSTGWGAVLICCESAKTTATLFKWRHFEPAVITCAVGWYLRFALSYRNVEELLTERGLPADHTTVWRWTQPYGPEVHRRLNGELKRKSSTWHMDETFVRIARRWLYLFRAVDSGGQPRWPGPALGP